ncbi:MAG: hypothetical protein RJQ14_01375 [Marinoscillum sp.]
MIIIKDSIVTVVPSNINLDSTVTINCKVNSDASVQATFKVCIQQVNGAVNDSNAKFKHEDSFVDCYTFTRHLNIGINNVSDVKEMADKGVAHSTLALMALEVHADNGDDSATTTITVIPKSN